jgi:hypothetical protein
MAGTNKGEPLPEWLKKYTSRYQLDKIKSELELNWGLKLYGYHTRGYYASFKLDLPDLAEKAEAKRISLRRKELADAKKLARQAAITKIKMNNKIKQQQYVYGDN